MSTNRSICYTCSMVRLLSLLLAAVLCGPVSAYERCLRIDNERSMLLCLARYHEVQQIFEANDRFRAQEIARARRDASETPAPAPDYSTPALRAQAVERLLREYRARQQAATD